MTAYEFIISMKNLASSQLRTISEELGNVGGAAKRTSEGIDTVNTRSSALRSTWNSMKGLVAGVFAAGVISSFATQVIDATAEYEKFEAVLTNTFQSKEMGNSAMAQITDFAKNTPYQLNEVTDSYIKLANRGIVPTAKEMNNLGDLASSQGKSFNQLTEALLDAQTGEFERLKEFGIRASKSGNQVAFTFKGVRKEVDMNDTAIKNAILSYGDMAGVSGTMAVISQTLGGRISNLKDQFWIFLVTIGRESKGAFNMFFNLLSSGLQYTQTFILGLISAGKWIASNRWLLIGLGLVVASIGLNFVIANISTLAYTGTLGILNGAIWLVTAATSAWNFVMAMNPISQVILVIGILITTVALLWSRFGWLRGTVLGVWGVLQGFGNMIKTFVITRIQELLSGITGIGQALVAFFKGDFSSAMDIGKKAAVNLLGVKSKSEFAKSGMELGTAFNKGMEEGMKEVATPKKQSIGMKTPMLPAPNDPTNQGLGKGLGKGTDKAKAKEKADSIVGGGSKQTTINITIGKLQDKTEIHVDSTEKGLNNLSEKVQEILLRAINSVNQMQT